MQTTQQDSREKKMYLVLHGHFYQPPRENPWTQVIPSQESAKPYHDWNDRITAECYKPNTRSRALDDQGRILELVNNFAFLNFNIGPTLMSWMEKYYPDTYQRILEADRKSLQRNQGHGNAIAQVYNHVIMPLANTRDKLTQIIWGKREFEYRFQREAESIWLAETAINRETVECLIEQGMKYVILSPTQAQRVRKIGETEWKDISNNGIDTTQPYRLFLREEHGNSDSDEESADPKYLDVFFYDGGLSTAISFQHLLRDANTFAHKLYESASKSLTPHALVHVATDGEIYGHHEAYGDMCLAAAFTSRFPALQVEVTNYGCYLELHPPTMEVELKPGDNEEGTAWSCAHGVGRWYRNCGCSASNNPAWNQEWRTPLRKGFDILRDALADLFEQIGAELLHDPWEARNDYIECMLDPSEQTLQAFLDKHARRELTQEERTMVLQLLEAQKYSQFSYTSCAWFFDDISGLEPIQNMRYAARAIQLIEGVQAHYSQSSAQYTLMTASEIETRMLAKFDKAKSNLTEYGTGKDIYRQFVKPDVYTPERAANQFLLENFINQRHLHESKETDEIKESHLPWGESRRIHTYTLFMLESTRWRSQPREKAEQQKLPETVETIAQHAIPYPMIYSGLLQVKEDLTQQEWLMLFISFTEQSVQPVSYIKRADDNCDWENFLSEMSRFTSSEGNTLSVPPSELVPVLEAFGCQRYGLADVDYDDRERLFCRMLEDHISSTESHIRSIYEDNLELLHYLTTMNVQVPLKLRASVKFSLSHQLMIEIEKLSAKDITRYSPSLLRIELERILHLSKRHQLELDTAVLQDHLSQTLTGYLANLSQRISSLAASSDADIAEQEQALQVLQETLKLLEKAKEIGVVLDKAEIQNIVHDMLERAIPRYLTIFKTAFTITKHPEDQRNADQQIFYRFFKEYTLIQECLQLAQHLNFNIARYRKLLLSSELGISELE